MAIPDPYKAAKPKTSIPVPKTTGAVPTPVSTPTKSMGAITASNTVPKPTNTVQSTPGLKPITATTNAIPKPNTAPKSAISTPAYTDWVAKQNEQYANLEKLINTPFTYDPEADPAYQAQRQLAQLRAADASRNALETANEKGILGSSMNVSQLGQIQQRAEQEAAAYIPEYRNQAYGQYQDRLRSAGELLGQARNLRGDRFNEAVTEGEMLGRYKSPELDQLERQLLDYKDQTERNWSNLSREQQLAARAEGDRLRAQIDALGGNSALFGADVASGAARGNLSQSGIMTQSAQNQQFNQGLARDQFERGNFESDRGFNEDTRRYDQNFQYTQGRDQVADSRWQQEFDRILKQDGVQEALAWAQHSVSQQNANTSAFSASNSANNANFGRLMDIWQATGSAPAGIPGVAQGTPYGSEMDRAYRQMQIDAGSNSSSSGSTSKPTKNELESEYYTYIDQIHPDQLRQFFKNEKSNIIKDLGKTGFDDLLRDYNIFDVK